MSQLHLLLEQTNAELRAGARVKDRDAAAAMLAELVLNMHDRTHEGAPLYCPEPACRAALDLHP